MCAWETSDSGKTVPPVAFTVCRSYKKWLSDELMALGYKDFVLLVCPVSGAVLDAETTDSYDTPQSRW